MPALSVLDQRGLALFEDAGRGHRSSGVPISGAFDRVAHEAACVLVGGSVGDASVEMAGTLALRAEVRCTVAVTGPAITTLDGRVVPGWTSLDVPAGARIDVVSTGRAYLAVAGGFRPEPVLGSRSTCLLGPLGPPPIRSGDRLPVAEDPTSTTVGDWCRAPAREHVLHVVPGPHLEAAATTVRVVDGSRVGVRVRPSRPVLAESGLPSLGVLPGVVQVLPSGDWMILGPDAGTMGGYPVVAVVCSGDLDRVAQLTAGERVRLRRVSAQESPTPTPPQVVRGSRL